ncbi:MAG: outer membrane lipoprotein-sorting protein [Tannerellaceae bacterium]|nr:outer membrane lipoprotein-sorting protein [Tannerellaceae bacterium]
MKKYLIIILLFSLSIGHAENYITDYIVIIDQLFHMEYTKVRMDVYKNDVLMKYYEMDCYRKDHKVRMDFTGPAVEKGRRMLDDESNIWMYMPRTSKIMKLPLKQSFMGSDASNRDVFRLKFGHEYNLVNTTPADQKITILELKAKDQSVAYSKVLIWFDEENRVPLKQEMYTLSGKKN